MDNRNIDTLMDYMNTLSIKELQDWILDLAEQNSDLRKERKKDKEIINVQRVRIKKLKEKLDNSLQLPCIKVHTTYPDIDGIVEHKDWYVIYKPVFWNSKSDEIFTIKCSSEENAKKELELIKTSKFRKGDK